MVKFEPNIRFSVYLTHFLFEHLLFDKHDYKRYANEHVYADDNPESPQFALKGNARVHAPKRRDHSRCVDEQRENGERFHDDVEVV